MIFKSYNIGLGTAELLNPNRVGPPSRIYLPLTLSEFGLGMYGANSWMHPTDLPPSHPNFVTWRKEEEHLVTHNRTGEVCYLLLSKEFHINGEFQLTPKKGGAIVFKSSVLYNSATARTHLDGLIGKEIIFRMRALSFLVNNSVEASILKLQTKLEGKHTPKRDITVVFTSLKWMSLASISLDYINLAVEQPTKKEREKWDRRAARKSK